MAGITGCDQRQGQMLDLFQKQIQEKDKSIEELNQKINELDRRNAELEGQIEKAADPDKIAEAVGKRIDGRLTDLRNHVDQLAQAGGGGAPRTASGSPLNPLPRGSEEPAPNPRLTNPPADKPQPTDPNRKKMKFDFN
ncbi:MAG TPA: hypothetical protein VGH90_11705 [Chthoniobacteraceae bacterium]